MAAHLKIQLSGQLRKTIKSRSIKTIKPKQNPASQSSPWDASNQHQISSHMAKAQLTYIKCSVIGDFECSGNWVSSDVRIACQRFLECSVIEHFKHP